MKRKMSCYYSTRFHCLITSLHLPAPVYAPSLRGLSGLDEDTTPELLIMHPLTLFFTAPSSSSQRALSTREVSTSLSSKANRIPICQDQYIWDRKPSPDWTLLLWVNRDAYGVLCPF